LKVWTVLVDVVQENLQFGFVAEPIGTHISRTIMLADLRLLLSSCHLTADIATYRQAVIEENVLHKRTVSTRRLSFKRLRELYILDKSILLFRALRDLWEYEPDAQPMLALLCAVARDPLLRSTVDTVVAGRKQKSEICKHDGSADMRTNWFCYKAKLEIFLNNIYQNSPNFQ
jgi:hypothetical protein